MYKLYRVEYNVLMGSEVTCLSDAVENKEPLIKQAFKESDDELLGISGKFYSTSWESNIDKFEIHLYDEMGRSRVVYTVMDSPFVPKNIQKSLA